MRPYIKTESPPVLPCGAFALPEGAVQWRVWAPYAQRVHLVFGSQDERQVEMRPEGAGYFQHREPQTATGTRYRFQLDGNDLLPDPASRWQPEGVHKASAVFRPDEFAWSDDAWRGIARRNLVFYELHVGTFTPEGTFDAIIPRLVALKELGITAIELMPVVQYPGSRGWGYEGVQLYAVQNSYGGPQGLQQLIDAAHRIGLAVFLDVVYNHLGPEGNYLERFGPYFTDGYHTPWGKAVNFDGSHCDPVRRFVTDNACYWVRDFHVDGLRLDAVNAIYDFGATHILRELKEAVDAAAAERGWSAHVFAESDLNDVRLIDSPKREGYGLDGVWSDDFHHAVHTVLTGERHGYYSDFGTPQHLMRALSQVYVYDGCYSPFRRRTHGAPAGDFPGDHFVVCVQNHDQIGNRPMGDRLGTILPPAAQRLAASLLLLAPHVPLIFMGEEYGEQNPFPFFCSFTDQHVIDGVRRGRREEFSHSDWHDRVPDALDPATFQSAKLSWSWAAGTWQAGLRELYRDLLSLRRSMPARRNFARPEVRLSDDAAIMEMARHGEGEDKSDSIVALFNLSGESRPCWSEWPQGRTLLFSSEWRSYSGRRDAAEPIEALLPFEALVVQ